MRKLLSIILLLAPLALHAAGEESVQRRLVVIRKGDQLVVESQVPLITITARTSAKKPPVTWKFAQYATTLTLTGALPGEVKLMLEGTDQQIHEVLEVVVCDAKGYSRYQQAEATMADVKGRTAADVQPAGNSVVVLGNVYSSGDLARCSALEKSAPGVLCAVRLSSAAAVLYPGHTAPASASVELAERHDPVANESTSGLESDSAWTAVVRLGDIPLIRLAGSDRGALLQRAARFASILNRAGREWSQAAERGKVYPAMIALRPLPAGRIVTMQWRFDQGTRGEPLFQFTPEDVNAAGGDRIIDWWGSLIHDAFRLYFAAESPKRTGDVTSPLRPLYDRALSLSQPAFDRSSAATSLARAWYSLQLENGTDPFTALLDRPSGAQ